MNDSGTDSGTEPRLGYIGLGNMGAPMAMRLAGWPGGLVVFDIRDDVMVPFADAGASVAESIADVAAADIISVTVLNDTQVREVVSELARHAAAGTVIAIHSTISDITAAELAAEFAREGIHVIANVEHHEAARPAGQPHGHRRTHIAEADIAESWLGPRISPRIRHCRTPSMTG